MGGKDGIGPVQKRESFKMHSHSTSQDLMACGVGALLFAGLALGVALFPLFAA